MKEDCDFLIRNKTIQETERANYEDLKARLLQRIQSNFFDWIFKSEDYASIPAANLSQFLGSPISGSLIDEMKRNIFEALTLDELVNPEKIYIQDVPIDRETIILLVSLKVENETHEFNLGMSVMYNTRQNITSAKIEKISEDPWV
jgi:hypothetical protein